MSRFIPESKHRLIMLGLLAVGIVLIILGTTLSSEKSDEGNTAVSADNYSSYERDLEARIESICLSVAGIDSAKALVTLERTTEKIYAQNTKSVSDQNSSQSSGEYPASALLLGEEYPTVRGVAVVVTGGERAEVKKILTEIISSSLGIPTNRIAVAPSKQ